jgi:GntR family transcriptional regulator
MSTTLSGVSRDLRYLVVYRSLRELLSSGAYSPGDLLPAESDLASKCQASRTTLRKALGRLKQEGLIDSRQGFGWFVVTVPLRQSLDALTTIEAQIQAAGRKPTRTLLTFSFRSPPPWVHEILLAEQVLEIARLNQADREVVGTNTAWVPGDLAADISLADVETHSLHALLPVPVSSATQTITAQGASPEDAKLLKVPTNSPLLRCRRVTYDPSGHPVLVSEAFYNPLRTEFVVDLPAANINATGLRLLRNH